jgi:flagellar export protein FliJ
MSRYTQDRALMAVRRVRDSREQDSRIGLQQALVSVRAREEQAARASARRTGDAGFGAGTVVDFQAYVARQAALVAHEQDARDRVESSRLVADEAERRWHADRQQVRTVELLLERRARVRREERARREARELDDLAGQAWLRRSSDHEGGLS